MTDVEKNAAEAVLYEVKHLVGAIKYRERLCSKGADPELARLLLEAFLLHYRNLRDFLESQSNSDDILASHFCQGWQSPDWRDHTKHPLSQTDDRYSERKLINKCLSHLTYFREAVSICWPLDGMYATAHDEFLRFVKLLSPEKQQWFAQGVSALSATPPSAAIIAGVSNSTETRGRGLRPFS